MLQPANEKLTSACLGDTWHENYPSFAMLFCMCSIFAMQLIEYLATTQLEHHFHSSALCVDHHHHDNSTVKSATTTTTTTHVNNMATTTIPETPQSPFQCEIHHYHPEHVVQEEENNNNTQPKSSSVTMIDESVANEDLYIYGRRAFSGNNTDEDDKDKLKHTPYSTCPEHWDSSSTRIAESMKDTKRCLSTIVLECGILTHSIIIGITMGVTGQDEFTGLMIAICFHQFFEGFALGARIAEVNRINCKKAIMMAFFFAWTTPVGTAIGVGISSSYNGNSAAALLAQGIFDSISSGILIYVGLVNLLASEMIFDDRFKKMRKSTRFGCFLFMYAGAAVMAIIGIWI
ncbi:hypothetical protein INT45_001540 [Circinella minor]|uniref:Uncharacterized protein n=1 Tax=Circinella minor TaxID=1195481 RepID=A0A8H7RVG5_9FUNG|nr:hypothetical protein INT45_001540 [Circinella minor]